MSHENSSPLQDMDLNRGIKLTHAHPLKSFVDPLELVDALIGAVNGLKSLYNAGNIYRNIRVGSILINKHDGALIDFEDGIFYETRQTLWDDQLAGTGAFLSIEMAGERSISPALQEAKQRISSLEPRIHTTSSFIDFMKATMETSPETSPSSASHGEDECQVDVPEWDAIHGVESVFWVLVWLCLTRSAPNERRPELNKKPITHREKSLHSDIDQLFESSPRGLANAKQLVMTDNGRYASQITRNITQFCMPLQLLVDEYRGFLIERYTTRNFDDVHDGVLALMLKTQQLLLYLYDRKPHLQASIRFPKTFLVEQQRQAHIGVRKSGENEDNRRKVKRPRTKKEPPGIDDNVDPGDKSDYGDSGDHRVCKLSDAIPSLPGANRSSAERRLLSPLACKQSDCLPPSEVYFKARCQSVNTAVPMTI